MKLVYSGSLAIMLFTMRFTRTLQQQKDPP